MADKVPKHLRNGFRAHPENINRTGQPKKIVGYINEQFAKMGYTPVTRGQIETACLTLINLPSEELEKVAAGLVKPEGNEKEPTVLNNEQYAIFYQLAAKELLGRRGQEMMATLLDRAIGKASQSIQVTETPSEPSSGTDLDVTEMSDEDINTILAMSGDLRVRLGINAKRRLQLQRELNNRSFYAFLLYFWDVITGEDLVANWHIKYICDLCQEAVERIGAGEIKLHDILINIPPGTTKTTIVSIMLPAWAWSKWFWMKVISASCNSDLALESSETCRDLIRSEKFSNMYPEIQIKKDKDTKSNYRIVKVSKQQGKDKIEIGGGRYTTSVGASVIGFHCHLFIWDDPLNPKEAASPAALKTVNHWIDQIISTRKIDKAVTVTIGIMQRLHQNDPSGHLLNKGKKNLKHICLPGLLEGYSDLVNPPELKAKYVNGLLDPVRLSPVILKELEDDLGQYGYSGQIGQKPTPPGGGMFQVDKFSIIQTMPPAHEIEKYIRSWDKAGTTDAGAYTAGSLIAKLKNGKYIIVDMKRGQWSSNKREDIIRNTAEADGRLCDVVIEQEPGSGGKESAEATVRNLAGYNVIKDLPRGDKAYRADPYSVQVNNGNVMILHGAWNHEFITEHEYFPFSKYKDQVDATSAGFNKLAGKRTAKSL